MIISAETMASSFLERALEQIEEGPGFDDLDRKSSEGGLSDNNDDDDEFDSLTVSSIAPTIRRSKVMIILVLLVGLGGGLAFLILGIRNENSLVDTRFETTARQLARDVGSTVQEYETAARSVHNVCRRRETTRYQFREFYEYLTSGGLQFQAAQCVPNVTHAQRPAYEQSAREYYSKYYPTTVNYTGFKGFAHDPETNTYPLQPVRDVAPFYFPVDMSEPVVPNAQALGLDTYSHPFQKREIEFALSTHQPVLGGRLKLVQETEENAYTVIMRHPGIPLVEEQQDEATSSTISSTGEDEMSLSLQIPRELGVILIRIPSLLKRRANEQKESIACYLYDITPANTGGVETYLGAAEYKAVLANDTIVTTVRIPPQDIEYDRLMASLPSHRIFQVQIPIANARWTMVVTPITGDDSFEASVGHVIFGSVMVFLVTLGVALFLAWNMRQVQQIHKAKNQADAERKLIASLYPENVLHQLLQIQRNKQNAAKEKLKNKGKVFEGNTITTKDVARNNNNSVPMGSNHVPSRRSGCESRPVDTLAMLAPCMMEGLDRSDRSCELIFGSQPIAHHYPETQSWYVFVCTSLHLYWTCVCVGT